MDEADASGEWLIKNCRRARGIGRADKYIAESKPVCRVKVAVS
jgi:hypothetical protein